MRGREVKGDQERLEGIERATPADDLAISAPRIASFLLASTHIADCKPFTMPRAKTPPVMLADSRLALRLALHGRRDASGERILKASGDWRFSGRMLPARPFENDVDEIIASYTAYALGNAESHAHIPFSFRCNDISLVNYNSF